MFFKHMIIKTWMAKLNLANINMVQGEGLELGGDKQQYKRNKQRLLGNIRDILRDVDKVKSSYML